MSKVFLTAEQIEAIERSARRARAAQVERMLRSGLSLLLRFVARLRGLASRTAPAVTI